MVNIKYSDIELACLFVNSAGPCMDSAYLSKKNGKIYYESGLGNSGEIPENLGESKFRVIGFKE